MDGETRRRELVRLVELELDGLRALVTGVLSTGSTVRVAGIAVWSAAMGGAIVNDAPLLAALGVVALSAFAIVDAYHGYLYAGILEELNRDEHIVARYYELCGRYPGDVKRTAKLDELLSNRTFGVHTKLRRGSRASRSRVLATLGVQQLFVARPRIIFRRLYPALLALGTVVGLLTLCA